MNYIEISINALGEYLIIYINVKNKRLILNNIEKSITEEKIYDLLRIIRNWKGNYQNSKIMDGESFKIIINTNEGTTIIKGKGNYPSNYQEFKELMNGIKEEKGNEYDNEINKIDKTDDSERDNDLLFIKN